MVEDVCYLVYTYFRVACERTRATTLKESQDKALITVHTQVNSTSKNEHHNDTFSIRQRSAHCNEEQAPTDAAAKLFSGTIHSKRTKKSNLRPFFHLIFLSLSCCVFVVLPSAFSMYSTGKVRSRFYLGTAISRGRSFHKFPEKRPQMGGTLFAEHDQALTGGSFLRG